MPLQLSLKQSIADSGLQTKGGIFRNADPLCNMIAAFESYPFQLFCNTIRIFPKNRIDFSLKMLINLVGQLWTDA